MKRSLRQISIARPALASNSLWVCVIQGPRPKEALSSGQANAVVRRVLQQLLTINENDYALLDEDCDDDDLLRIVLLPELSLGLDDFDVLNSLVDKYPRKLIVSAGFGFTQTKDLRAKGATFIPAQHSDTRPVNFGSIWISAAATGTSLQQEYFCKNFAEQAVEVTGFDPVLVNEVLAVEFNDLTIAPLICADLLEDTDGERENAIDRVRKLCSNGRPLLMLGSLLQPKPWHPIWTSKLDRAVDCPAYVVLANTAGAQRPTDFADDFPRNLTGVYTNVSQHKDKPHWNTWAGVRHGVTLTGHPIRDVNPLVVAGQMRFAPYSPTLGRHLWTPRWAKWLDKANTLSSAPTHGLAYELPRILARGKHLPPSDTELLDEVGTHLNSVDLARKVSFFTGTLRGPLPRAELPKAIAWESANDCSTRTALQLADALARTSAFHWPVNGDATLAFQANIGAGDIEVPTYVWISSEVDAEDMTRSLSDYAQDQRPRPAIVVIAADANQTPVDALDIRRPRDITSEVNSDLSDFTVPRKSSNIIAVADFGTSKKLSARVKNKKAFDETFEQLNVDLTAQLSGKI